MTKRTKTSLRAAVVTMVAAFVLPAGAEPQTETQTQAPTQTQSEPATPSEPTTPNETPTRDETQAQESLELATQETLENPPPSTTAKILDVLILRPLGLAVVPVGAAAFIPAALLTAPNGLDSVQSALEIFVTGPVNYVFQRPLGEI